MEISQVGINLIKKHEGLKLRSYLCPAGVWTIGYGTTGPQVKPNMVITKAEAEQLLANDLVKFTNGVIEALSPTIPTQNQLDALVSFSYNVGLANFRKSTPCKCLKAGNKESAAKGFLLWTKAKDPKTGQLRELPGLVQRRTEEMQLFASDGTPNVVERTVAPSKTTDVLETSVEPVAPKSLSLSKEIIGGAVAGAGGLGQLVNSLTTSDLEQARTGTIQVQTDAKNSHLFNHYHMPEIAASMAVVLSMFIIWKRISDRTKGIR